MAVKINDASTFGSLVPSGRQLVVNSSGYLYAVLRYSTNSDLEIWRSTDGGDTWSEQDSSNKPLTVSYNDIAIAIDSSDVIHIIYHTVADTVAYATFNTSSNVWVTVDESVTSSW